MASQESDILSVDPDQLTRLIDAYQRAIDSVGQIVIEVRRSGRLNEAWAGDKVSIEMARHYNEQVFDAPHSTYAALNRYQTELHAVISTLRQIRDGYSGTEGEAAASFRLR